MRNGKVTGTRFPTGHTILLDARFELPYGTSLITTCILYAIWEFQFWKYSILFLKLEFLLFIIWFKSLLSIRLKLSIHCTDILSEKRFLHHEIRKIMHCKIINDFYFHMKSWISFQKHLNKMTTYLPKHLESHWLIGSLDWLNEKFTSVLHKDLNILHQTKRTWC